MGEISTSANCVKLRSRDSVVKEPLTAPDEGPGSSCRSCRVRPVTRPRILLGTVATLLVSLALAGPAMAKGGEGPYGKYDDKVVTNFGFGLIIFFTLLVIVLSVGQSLLERRKRS